MKQPADNIQSPEDMEKKPIKKNHIKEFGGRKPHKRPRDKFGTSRAHPADLCGDSDSKGRMSAGQTGHMTGQIGHVHGTDGTQTRGSPAKILFLCLLVFFFTQKSGARIQHR